MPIRVCRSRQPPAASSAKARITPGPNGAISPATRRPDFIGFADFTLYRLEPEAGLLNGGFARAYRLGRDDLLSDETASAALAGGEAGAIAHMNSDHADAVENYARHYARAPAGRWTLTGIDPDGFDLALGDEIRRVFFEETVNDATAMRMALVDMARKARTALSE